MDSLYCARKRIGLSMGLFSMQWYLPWSINTTIFSIHISNNRQLWRNYYTAWLFRAFSSQSWSLKDCYKWYLALHWVSYFFFVDFEPFFSLFFFRNQSIQIYASKILVNGGSLECGMSEDDPFNGTLSITLAFSKGIRHSKFSANLLIKIFSFHSNTHFEWRR